MSTRAFFKTFEPDRELSHMERWALSIFLIEAFVFFFFRTNFKILDSLGFVTRFNIRRASLPWKSRFRDLFHGRENIFVFNAFAKHV